MWALIATLVIVGLLLLGIELLVIPGFGVVGILGIVSFVCSCYFSFATFGVTAGVAVLIAEIVLVSAFIVLVLRSKTWRKITLNTNIDSKVDELPQMVYDECGVGYESTPSQADIVFQQVLDFILDSGVKYRLRDAV